MSAREFSEWIEFYKVEPFGETRADIQAGVIASTVANTARDEKRKPEPFTPGDFITDWWGDHQPDKTPSDMYAMLRTWAQLSGAKKAQ